MKKAFVLISALLFASCSFWNEPVEEFFSYWSAEAYITDSSVSYPNQPDGDGVINVASNKAAIVILKTVNPKSFRFIMPSSGNTGMIHFNGFETQPEPDTDYTLEQISADKLKLTFKQEFLKQYEWGAKDLGASLTLFADDGRKFNKPYTFKIKSNTMPPTPTVILAKTRESTPHYVLCLSVPDMNKMLGTEKIHKDIAQIVINESSYELKINDLGSDFVKPTNGSFIKQAEVAQLTGAEAVPAGNWILYYKTDREVGGAYKTYEIKLKDEKGVCSETLKTGTSLNKLPSENVTIVIGEEDSGTGTEDEPIIIKPANSTSDPEIRISHSTSGAAVYCTVIEVKSTTPMQYTGNPVTVPLALGGANEKTYEIKYHSECTNYNPSDVQTKYYKILKLHTVTFNANGGKFADNMATSTATALHGRKVTAPSVAPTRDEYVLVGWYKEQNGTTEWGFDSDTIMGDTTLYAKWTDDVCIIKPNNPTQAWRELKTEVESGTRSVIVIDGEIKATTDSGNSGEITIGRNLTIQGKTGATTDKLNVNSQNHRIFKVTGGKTLTLKKLTLTDGGTVSSSNGGAITSEGTLNTENIVITDCWAAKGGAIYAAPGATVNLDIQTTIENCKARDGGAIYNDGGSLTIKGASKIKVNEATNNGGAFLIKGGSLRMENNCIIKQNKAKNGGGIYITDSAAAAEILYCQASQNEAQGGDTYDGGGGIYVLSGTLTMTGCKLSSNTAKNGGAINLKGGNGMTLTNCTITDNEATNGDGGGINFDNGTYDSEYKIMDSTISNNKITMNDSMMTYSGGGIAVGNININITIESCTIKENTINGGASRTPRGAGIWLGNNANCTINNNTIIQGNKMHETGSPDKLIGSGGGIQIDGGNLTLTGTTKIIGNGARQGGGIYIPGGGVTMNGIEISGNTAIGSGGGIYTEQGKLGLVSTTIKSNKATTGGGIGLLGGNGMTLTDCTITDNEATNGDGGGINFEYGTYNSDEYEYKIIRSTISNNKITMNDGNTQRSGGGIAIQQNSITVTIDKCEIQANTINGASDKRPCGAGLFLSNDNKCTINNTLIANNKMHVTDSSDNLIGLGGGILLGGANSELTLTGTTEITGNSAKEGGGGIYASNGKVTMKGGTISGNKVQSSGARTGGGGVYIDGGATFTMKGGTISGITATTTGNPGSKAMGGGVCVSGSGSVSKFIMEDDSPKITGNKVKTNGGTDLSTIGGGVCVCDGATFEMKAGSIESNEALEGNLRYFGHAGGGVCVGGNGSADASENLGYQDDSASFTMTGGTISNNEAGYGGGVAVTSKSTFTMSGNDSKISGNKATYTDTGGNKWGSGGGVSVLHGTLNMTGGEITGNDAGYGGGISGMKFNGNNGTITVSGNSSISANIADSGGGGGISSSYNLSITEDISGNKPTIQNNKAKSFGGGIYLPFNSKLTFSGGVVTDNAVTGNSAFGNGMYLQDNTTTVKMSGSATVAANNDVYLKEGAKITVDSVLTGTAPVARITVPNNKYLPTTQVLTGTAVNTEHTKFSVTRGGTPPKNWYVGNDGKLTDNPAAIFNTISKAQIQAAESSMTKTTITDRQTNLLHKLILYKTSEGNYGIMHVTEVHNTDPDGFGHITFNYKTFKSNGTIKQSSNNEIVKGTFKFDLDEASNSDTNKDFWLENTGLTSSTRHFSPENGAKFYVLP